MTHLQVHDVQPGTIEDDEQPSDSSKLIALYILHNSAPEQPTPPTCHVWSASGNRALSSFTLPKASRASRS